MTNVKLYKGDCLTVLQDLILTGTTVDSIICDLPYGTSAAGWDSVINIDEMWRLLRQIRSENCPIVLFGCEPFSSVLRISNPKEYKYDWKWEKPSAANFLNFKYQPAKVHEDILVFGNKPTSFSGKNATLKYYPQMEQGAPYVCKQGKIGEAVARDKKSRENRNDIITNNSGSRYPRSVQRFSKDKEKLHPTQKPLSLLEYLVKTYTKEGDTVLDFCMGSGTAGVVCKRLGRNFIGIEKEDKYFEIAKERINNDN